MIYINIIFLLFVFGLFVLSIKDPKNEVRELNHKEHKLYFLYPVVWKFVSITRLDQFLSRKTRMLEVLRILDRKDNHKVTEKWYWCQKLSIVMFVLILCNVLSILGWLSMISLGENLKDYYLVRPEIGEGESEISLKVVLNDSKEEEADGFAENLRVIIEEREYTEDELEIAFEKGIQYLESKVLGMNKDKNQVTEDLNFITNLTGTGLRVEWSSEDIKIIARDGTIHNEELPPTGVKVSATAHLSYKKQKKEHKMEFNVLPKPLSDHEQVLKDLKKALQANSDDAKNEKKWELPQSIGEYSLSWEEIKQNPGITITLLGILSAVIVWVYGDKELQNRLEKRNAQLLLDYPELINKFTLLVNAGMTIKQAWVKITEDYVAQLDRGMMKPRYVYEEMRLTIRELKLGVPEGEAYEQFGRRAGVLPYMRFGTLIAQNLRKGSKGLSDILNKEATDAFADRKEHAKRLGEEAGTKLLGPMMVMLMIVLVIVIIPAFMSFRF